MRSGDTLVDMASVCILFAVFLNCNNNIISHTFTSQVAVRILQESCCDQYRWMTIAAGIFGFLMAFGIGANDVANAFATSVSIMCAIRSMISITFSRHMMCV